MRYFLVAGEASGDLHASALIRALGERDPEASFAFMGGDQMQQAAGTAPIVHYRDVAFMGFVSVLANLGTLRKRGRQVQQALLEFQPDVVIPVDYADFNLRFILPFARQHFPSVRIIYYILPKLWAWRSGRIRQLRRWVDHALSILPFEVDYFRQRGLEVTYVGNPCIDAQLRYLSEHPESAVRDERLIALLPGSRLGELRANLPTMLAATKPFREAGYRLVIAGAPGRSDEEYRPYLSGQEVEICWGDSYGLMRRASVALVTSGTATLETGMWHTPMVVCYRMGGQRLVRWLFDHFFRVPYISLVNLILQRQAVPELLGDRMNAHELGKQLSALLPSDDGHPSEAYARQREALTELTDSLGHVPSAPRAAEVILRLLGR